MLARVAKSKNPPTEAEAWNVVATSKRIDETRASIFKAARDKGSEYGAKIGGHQWCVEFYRGRGSAMLRCLLKINGKPIVGLDYHALKSIDGQGSFVPPGYHWDVYSPLMSGKFKFKSPLQVSDPDDIDRADRAALATICKFWHIRCAREPRRLIRPRSKR